MINIYEFLSNVNDILDAAYEYYLEYGEHEGVVRVKIYKEYFSLFVKSMNNIDNVIEDARYILDSAYCNCEEYSIEEGIETVTKYENILESFIKLLTNSQK